MRKWKSRKTELTRSERYRGLFPRLVFSSKRQLDAAAADDDAGGGRASDGDGGGGGRSCVEPSPA